MANSCDREIDNTKEYAITKFAKDLVEVQENFKRALQSISSETLAKKGNDQKAKMELYNIFVEGVSMTHDILNKTFKKYGIIEYNPTGDKFDPNLHEASFEFPDSKKTSGTIGEIVQSGYKIGKRILRVPKVGVVKNPKADKKA